MDTLGPTPTTDSNVTTIRFGSWNVNARSSKILPQHLELLRQSSLDLVALQEVTELYYRALSDVVGEENIAFSLDIQPPSSDARQNRRLGCAIVALNPDFSIVGAHLIETTVCPERSLVARVVFRGHELCAGSFHSPNGSNWGHNKALWFHGISHWVQSQVGPLIFGIDANTPKRADLPDHDPRKWWDQDIHPSVGNAACNLVGDEPRHELRDAWKAVNPAAAEIPVSYNRDNRRNKRPDYACRYDFVYASTHFEPTACHYYYEEATNGPIPLSDHALVVADLRLTARSGNRPAPTKESVTMPTTNVQIASRPANAPAGVSSIPDVAAYERAFREIVPQLSHGYRQMLLANLNAPGRAISPHDLAEAAGYATYAAVNLHYGKLGAKIGEVLGYRPTKLSLQGKECQTFTFADWQGGKWVLLENAAAALSKIGRGGQSRQVEALSEQATV